MKKLMQVVLGVAVMGTLCMAAEPQATAIVPSIKAGTQEIVVGGMLDPSSADGETFALSARYGLFIMDCVEVGGYGAWADSDAIGTEVDAGVFAEYNFDLQTQLVPFVGVGAGYRFFDWEGNDEADMDDALVGSASAGVKYFLANNIAIRLAANFEMSNEDVYSDEDGDVEKNDFNVTLGMAFYLP